MTWRIDHGDLLELLPAMPAESVDVIVTSPPYWLKRNYGLPPSDWPDIVWVPMMGIPYQHITPAQKVCLGLEADVLDYIGHIVHVFRLARRVLKKSGVLYLNIGDKYVTKDARDRVRADTPMRVGRKAVQRNMGDGGGSLGLKRKNMYAIPARVKLALQADGWILRNTNIWHKSNVFLDGARDRCTVAYEPVFLFSRIPKHFHNMNSVRQPYAASTLREFRRAYNGKARGDYAASGAQDPSAAKAAFIKRHTVRAEDHSGGGQGSGLITVRDMGGSNLRNVWKIPTESGNGKHTACFPRALAKRCIQMGCPPGGTVLDIFAGHMTTLIAAESLGFDSIGIEMSAEYVESGKERIEREVPALQLFNTTV